MNDTEEYSRIMFAWREIVAGSERERASECTGTDLQIFSIKSIRSDFGKLHFFVGQNVKGTCSMSWYSMGPRSTRGRFSRRFPKENNWKLFGSNTFEIANFWSRAQCAGYSRSCEIEKSFREREHSPRTIVFGYRRCKTSKWRLIN